MEDKKKALSIALEQIEKTFGKGSVMIMGKREREKIPAISTGSITTDIALGVGGVPRGRIVEIFGPESSGKTTVALSTIAQCQKQGGTAAFIDAEHALDTTYAKKLGVDVENLVLSQPDHGEQALEIADLLVRSGAVDLIVIDSVAALVPKAEIAGEMGEHQIGLQARLMSHALRKITGNINKSHCTVIFINQIRMKIGVMFGSPETTAGGNALKFYASVRMDIRRQKQIKEGEVVIGQETKIKVVKNKVAPPFKEANFEILYDSGINKLDELIELGSQISVIDKAGSWYSYKGTKLGQGKPAVVAYLKANDHVLEEVSKAVYAHFLDKADESVANKEKTTESSEEDIKGKKTKVVK